MDQPWLMTGSKTVDQENIQKCDNEGNQGNEKIESRFTDLELKDHGENPSQSIGCKEQKECIGNKQN